MKLYHLLTLCLLAATASLAADRYSSEDVAPFTIKGELKDGKVALNIVRRVLWTSKPSYPLQVAIKGKNGGVVATRKVETGGSVELSGLLAPGEYTIFSEIDEASGYWSSHGGRITVAADGEISIQPHPIDHQLKMTEIAPAQMEVVEVARPTLKWKPVDGAKSYTLRWFESYTLRWFEMDRKTRAVLSEKQGITVNRPEWSFDSDVIPGRTYEWQVEAWPVDVAGEHDVCLAYSSGYFSTK